MANKTKYVLICVLSLIVIFVFKIFFEEINNAKDDNQDDNTQVDTQNSKLRNIYDKKNSKSDCITKTNINKKFNNTVKNNNYKDFIKQKANIKKDIEQKNNKMDAFEKKIEYGSSLKQKIDQKNSLNELTKLTDNKIEEIDIYSLTSSNNTTQKQSSDESYNMYNESKILKKHETDCENLVNFEVIQDNNKVIFQMAANKQQRADLLLYVYLLYNNITDEKNFQFLDFPCQNDSVYYLKIKDFLIQSQDTFFSKFKKMGSKRLYTALVLSINLLFKHDSKKFFKLKRDTQIYDNSYNFSKEYYEMSDLLHNFFYAFKKNDFFSKLSKVLKSSKFFTYKKQLIEDVFLSSLDKNVIYHSNMSKLSILDYIIFIICVSL